MTERTRQFQGSPEGILRGREHPREDDERRGDGEIRGEAGQTALGLGRVAVCRPLPAGTFCPPSTWLQFQHRYPGKIHDKREKGQVRRGRTAGSPDSRTSGFNDTSGFCSSESAYFSSERSYISNRMPPSPPFFECPPSSLRREHLLPVAVLPDPPAEGSSQPAELLRHSSVSLSSCPDNGQFSRRPAQQTVQCRLLRDDEVAPYIADLRGPFVTLYQFRKTFAIRKDDNLR